MSSLLELQGLTKHFDTAKGRVHAVDGVSLSIGDSEIVGLVGESGSGKSTVGKCILRLLEPTSGSIVFQGTDITHLSRKRMLPIRENIHMVFQDPYSSLDPRMTTGQIVAEPLLMHRRASGTEVDRQVGDMFERVGLPESMRFRYPHELSGGQRQRVGLARSLILQPKLLVADEPLSALDVSAQASIINLLLDLQRDIGFSCLFIAHDLATVAFLCQRIAVMYLGRVVEVAPRGQLFNEPRHPYTKSLLSSSVVPDPVAQRQNNRVILQGEIPSPLDPPRGCHFHPRCPIAQHPLCSQNSPELKCLSDKNHLAACHLVDETEARRASKDVQETVA